MSQDYVLWDIDELLKAYINAPDMAERVKIKMESLFLFLERNALLACRISNENGQVVKRILKKSELTDEADRLCAGPRNAVHRWLGSKSSHNRPPDMMLLEKALADIRNEYDQSGCVKQ